MDEKEQLKLQKEKLAQDIKKFNYDYVQKIAYTTLEKDKFDELGVFGNFYSLAVENYPNLAKEVDDIIVEQKSVCDMMSFLQQTATEEIKYLLNKHNVSFGIKVNQPVDPREYELNKYDLYLGGEKYSIGSDRDYSSFVEIAINKINLLIKQYEHLKDRAEVKEYLNLCSKLESNRFIDKATRAITQSKLKRLIKENYYVKRFDILHRNRKAIYDVKSEIESNKNVGVYFEGLEKQKDVKDKIYYLKKILNEKSTYILAMAYAKLYKENYELLRMSSVGAKAKLLELTTNGIEYYAKGNIESVAKNIDKWIVVSNIASNLHDGWREPRKREDGTYEPRWKKVKDEAFINATKQMKKLPDTIRIIDGVVEQDIANTKFDDLCLDYKLENFEAANIALEVSKQNYKNSEAGIAGKKIHDEWLKRNPWSKGSDLDVEFEDLILSEKMKDLIQVEIAKKVMAEVDKEAK